MALNIPVAAHAPGLLNEWLGPALMPRVDQDVFPTIHARNTSTETDTVNLFIDSVNEDYEYAASIVTACVDQTVYALQCTSAPLGEGTAACGVNAPVFTMTEGPSTYAISTVVSTRTLGSDIIGTVEETCTLAGITAATCTATVKATVGTTSSAATTAATMTGATYYRFDVAITGGAEKTVNPTATCVAKKGAAASFNTKHVMTWALAGVAGVLGMQMLV